MALTSHLCQARTLGAMCLAYYVVCGRNQISQCKGRHFACVDDKWSYSGYNHLQSSHHVLTKCPQYGCPSNRHGD